MDLRNWEHFADTGLPVNGATVEARLASLTSPNVGSVVATTTTNADGMWSFAGLADVPHDIKVSYLSQTWWYKGLSRHSTSALFTEGSAQSALQFPLTRNGGMESWESGVGPIALSASIQSVADQWLSWVTGGSSGSITKETTIKAPDSLASAKLIFNRVAGSLFMQFNLPTELVAALRGKSFTVSAQARQGVASSSRLYIQDSAGTTNSSTNATTGSFITHTVTRTIDANATGLGYGLEITASDTVYLDNVVDQIGNVAPVYAPNPLDAFLATELVVVDQAGVATSSINTLQATLNAIVGRLKNITGATNWYDAAVATLAALNTAVVTTLPASIALKVAKAGDAMTGALTLTGSGASLTTRNTDVTPAAVGLGALNAAGDNWDFLVQHNAVSSILPITIAGLITGQAGAVLSGDLTTYRQASPGTGAHFFNSGKTVYIFYDGANFQFVGGQLYRNGALVWDAGNDGVGSGLDADVVRGLVPGNGNTNIPINNGSVNTSLNADMVDGFHGTAFVQLTTSGNQTISSNGGQIIVGVIPSGPLSGAAGAQVIGSFAATGTKSRIATGHDGVEGLFHAIETPLPMFEEYGRARLKGDRVWVPIPDDFRNYVSTEGRDYFVQLQAEGMGVLAVTDMQPWGFYARLVAGQQDIPFTWHLIARQGDMAHIERNLPTAGA